jgi:hypothetical protein
MKMVERMVFAIAGARNRSFASPRPLDGTKEAYRDEAIAALKTMRAATAEMIEAGAFEYGPTAACTIWEEMIDAAIKEAESE